MGSAADVDKAVKAARKAFGTWSVDVQGGAPRRAAGASWPSTRSASATWPTRCTRRWARPRRWPPARRSMMGIGHLMATAIDVLKNFKFEEQRGATMVVKEPIGVCGLITPWNWPMNQIACKVFPALAAGCTMVLKPSEVAPFSGQIFAEIMDAAGVPAGVFNMVYGDGPGVGVGAVQPSRHRHGVVHRLDPRRHRGGPQRRADRQARHPGTGRQEPQHRARRRRLRQERRRRRRGDDDELRPDLQRAVAHAGAQAGWTRRSPWRKAAAEGVTVGDPTRQLGDRPGGLQGAVRQDPGPDPEGHRRGRDPGRRRPGPARRPGQGLLRAARRCSPTSPTT